MMQDTIVLCGFMGCGKSAVGRRLSFYTRRPLIDMDAYIEEQAGMEISEIFARQGESYFRELEHRAVVELAGKKRLILSTGGGALTFSRNVEAFRRTGCKIVLIDASLEAIAYRLRNDTRRPLLQRPDREQAMKALYESRMPLYRAAADITVNGDRQIDGVAHEIMIKTGILTQDCFLERTHPHAGGQRTWQEKRPFPHEDTQQR